MRIIDLIIGFPIRLLLIIISTLFWSVGYLINSIGDGNWSRYKDLKDGFRWAWNPKLEPHFWPEDGGNWGDL